MIRFTANVDRTIEAISFLIQESSNRGRVPTQYEIVKSLFLADRAHLNRFGRPITFDRYVAMLHGPVPSLAYDLLKPDFAWSTVGQSSPPWRYESDGPKKRRYFLFEEAPQFNNISQSDQGELRDALSTVQSLTFPQLRRLTHEDPAYVSAWRDDDEGASYPMDMALLLDDRSDAAMDDLRYLAELNGGDFVSAG